MKIKTFPIKFTEEKLKEIGEAANKENTSKLEFILNAIEEKIGMVNLLERNDFHDEE